MGRPCLYCPYQLVLVSLLAIISGSLAAEGGFGYDASSACSKPSSRVARARGPDLPCDFRQENWCTIAGNAYPWRAVRRFVQENQGLMRRMYGDEKHFSILQKDFEKNDVELELETQHNQLYPDDASVLYSQFPFEKYELQAESLARFGSARSLGQSDEPATTEPPPTAAAVQLSLTEIATVHNLSINEILGEQQQQQQSIDRFDADVELLTEIPETTLPPDETTLAEQSSGELLEQQFRPRPEYRPTDAKPNAKLDAKLDAKPEPKPDAKPDTQPIEGQLFQDVAAKDKQEAPVLKVRGINACPVKEEVVAPFWANNTRGEVLALLNLYPFEQYVHWEKCTHENKQMYCREGCRCEQQYRLHRLLAYDPNNECRGIFSDWFKFPSCCICRCYDLPVEFRVTSRSPRHSAPDFSPSHRLKVAGPRYPADL